MENILTQDILKLIDKEGAIVSLDLCNILHHPHQKIVGAIKSLESLGDVVEVIQKVKKSWLCTEEGENLARNGSHEAKLFNYIPPNGETIDNIKSTFPASAIALGAALKNKWIRKDRDKIYRCVDQITDKVQNDLQAIRDGFSSNVNDKTKADYKKRKLIKEIDVTYFEVRKGQNFSTTVSKQEAELTKEMIESGQWKNKNFKPFNFNSKGKYGIRPGYLHPLMQLRGEFRHIFLEMGFTEMPTNNYIESAFWNFDALFQPQQHPARDAQDTFYISRPEKTISVPMDYLERVKTVHTVGGYGSSGYRSPWSFEESQKNLLRTHTTAVSARLLVKLAQEGFKPVKYFSIDKVYRNETLDATHLAEFYQVEGVIADYDLSVKHLMGMFAAFYEKIGIRNIRFKPTYNPYTEPSMEIYSFHKGLNKWVEVGNSGYFRPEMLRPMGLPKNITVAGWGLSLERPAMIMYGINNIRELVGSKVKMELILDNPICTIDKFGRGLRREDSAPSPLDELDKIQNKLLKKLEDLESRAINIAQKRGLKLDQIDFQQKGKVVDLPSDIVITAHPSRQPYSLIPLVTMLSEVMSIAVHVHIHSSIDTDILKDVDIWSKMGNNSKGGNDIRTKVTLVWKDDKEVALQPTLSINPLASVKVMGEANIARYLCRLIETCKKGDHYSLYEGSNDPDLIESIDQVLDFCHNFLSSKCNKSDTMNFIHRLAKALNNSANFLCGNMVTLADILALSILKQLDVSSSSMTHLQSWIQNCSKNKITSLLLKNS